MERYYQPDLNKLEAILVSKGWSQSKLADSGHLSHRTVDAIFAGSRVLRSTLKKLANVLGVSPQHILPGPSTYTEDVLPRKKLLFTFVFEYDGPFPSFNETSDLERFVQQLSQVIQTTYSNNTRASEGTTLILVDVEEEHIVPLLLAYYEHHFDELLFGDTPVQLKSIYAPVSVTVLLKFVINAVSVDDKPKPDYRITVGDDRYHLVLSILRIMHPELVIN